MTWRAHIEHKWDRDLLHLHLLDSFPGGYVLLGPGGESLTRVEGEGSLIAEDTPTPALILPERAAPVLLAALSRHLGTVEHPEQLRRDYDAERARVDRFIAHLTTGASHV